MSKIFRVPRGLRSFFNMENFGQAPADLSQVVVPTVSMEPFYAAESMQWFSQAAAVRTTDGIVSGTLVFSGELWFLHGVGAFYTQTNGAVNDGCRLSVNATNVPNGNPSVNGYPIAHLGDTYAPATQGAMSFARWFDRPIPLSQNATLNLRMSGSVFTGAGNISCQFSFCVSRTKL